MPYTVPGILRQLEGSEDQAHVEAVGEVAQEVVQPGAGSVQ